MSRARQKRRYLKLVRYEHRCDQLGAYGNHGAAFPAMRDRLFTYRDEPIGRPWYPWGLEP